MENIASFEIYYDGPLLESGEMDIRELAPALMSLGDLFDQANRVLYGEKSKIKVNVKSGFKRGSFGVSVEAYQTFIGTVVSLFSANPLEFTANIAQILGFVANSSIGLINLVKQIGTNKIANAEELKDGTVNLTINGNGNTISIINVAKPQFTLLADLSVRDALSKMTEPLHRQGIENFKIKNDGVEVENISKEEVSKFSSPEVEEEFIEEEISKPWLSIHSIVFGKDKWRFTDGNNATFWAVIEDNEFLNEVLADERAFSKGDLLKVELKKSYYQTQNGVKTEYAILKLIEHRKAMKQIPITYSVKE